MYHSKLSRKKKLCLDAQVLTEAQSIKSDFQYSFKIDKHYFNVIQSDDNFELRIDNRSFNTLLAEEKNAKHKVPAKEEKMPKKVKKGPLRYGYV
jgi:hypothetical protein